MPEILICSIAPTEFKIRRSYSWNDLIIPPCDGVPYTSLKVGDMMDVKVIHTEYDASKAERIPITITAKEIVNDFFNVEQLAMKGCFIPKGAEPTEKELKAAHAARRAYLQKCVQDGDIAYSRYGKIDEIPGYWKDACEELGVERDWAFTAPRAMMDCPACGEKLLVGVAICKSCHAILDKKRALEFGLIEEPVKVTA